MTKRLYYSDAYQTEFDAVITDLVTHGETGREKQAVILDHSCFYPTSGGQAFDTGVLTVPETGDSFEVVDVVGEAGEPVLHLLKPKGKPTKHSSTHALQVGMALHGTINWPRRYDHMQQHSSQHLLSHALDARLGYETVSVHFGASESTIDVSQQVGGLRQAQPPQPPPELVEGAGGLRQAQPTESESLHQPSTSQQSGKSDLLTTEQLADVERYVNAVVYRNVPITAYFVDDAGLSKLPLRRPPKVTGQIRIVEIAELDYSACGGTHCRQSGELGPIKILKQERQRNNIRLTFVSGRRALADYDQKHRISGEIAGIFSNEIAQTPELVRTLLEQNRVLEKRLSAVNQRMLRYWADELWQAAESVGPFKMVAQFLEDLEPNDAKHLAAIIQERSDAIVLFAISGTEKLTVIFAKGNGPTLHMGNLLRSTLAEFGGGGGGREDFAQGGGIPAATATAVLAAAVAQVQVSTASV